MQELAMKRKQGGAAQTRRDAGKRKQQEAQDSDPNARGSTTQGAELRKVKR
jgi:hypothetical protein